MEKLIKRIKEEATVIDNKIIKVDHFINHMLDTKLVDEIGKEFAKRFPKATKILTIETSGIAFALATAIHLNNVPVVFARKKKSLLVDSSVYTYPVYSFTKQKTSNITVAKEFLKEADHILIIDDFLANGEALNGLIEIAKQANATIVGAGIVIEKAFQNGRLKVEKHQIHIESLAVIQTIEDNQLIFI